MRKPKKDHHALTPEQRTAYDVGFSAAIVRDMAERAKLVLSEMQVRKLADTLNWWRQLYRPSRYEPEPGEPAKPAPRARETEAASAAVAPPALRMTARKEAENDLRAARADRALAFALPIAETIEAMTNGAARKEAIYDFIRIAAPGIAGETITSSAAVRVHLIRARKS